MSTTPTTRLLVQRLHHAAVVPKRASSLDAGYDLHALADLVVQPGERAVVPTGIAVRVPDGTYGRVAPRSGLAVKHGIDTLAGVVDQGYTGEIKVVLINHGDQPFTIAHQDRVAQLVLERIATPDTEEVDALPASDRGTGGFGSTGGFGAPGAAG
jgi:dUTP pyrophosphatase